VELYTDFEDTRKGRPSKGIKLWHQIMVLSNRVEEFRGSMVVRDWELMVKTSRVNDLLEDNRILKEKGIRDEGETSRANTLDEAVKSSTMVNR
jgi:hypothetical protein